MSQIVKPHEDVVFKHFSTLVGKILTQIEAAIADPTQRKSFKKIVEGQIYDCRNDIMKDLDKIVDTTEKSR
jgi:hypothetical protein